MVSVGEWKDYAIFINKNIVGFNIYRRATENPLYQIVKNLNAKNKNEKFSIQDQSGAILKKIRRIKKYPPDHQQKKIKTS